MIKVLLVVVALLLLTLLLRPQATTAQSAGSASPVMSVENGMIYVLQNNKLSVYYADAGFSTGNFFDLGDPQKRLAMLKRTRIYHLATQDLSTAAPPPDTPTVTDKPKGK